MNLRELVELIGVASAHSPNLIEGSEPLPAEALQRYACWSEMRNRHWVAVLDDLAWEMLALPASLRPLLWQRAETTYVDVLAGGLVARVWGAVLTACGHSHRTLDGAKVAHAVLEGQLQAQRGALRMLVDGPHLSRKRVLELDGLRRRMERWTDLLLGHLVRRYALADFAYDVDRALDFGDEQVQDGWGTRQHPVWELYFLCLRSGFPRNRLPGGIQAIWRSEVVESILACFSPGVFQSEGPLMSVRMKRLLFCGARPEGPGSMARPGKARVAGRHGHVNRRPVTE